MTGHVDDGHVFKRLMRRCYGTFEEFNDEFRQFQRHTSTSFFIYAGQTAKNHAKRGRDELPLNCTYYYVNYRCVHGRRRGPKCRRYADLNCQASLILRWTGGCYEIVRSNLKHVHSFQVGHGHIYTRNRELTADEREQMEDLVRNFTSTRYLLKFAEERFGCILTRHDISKLRRAYLVRSGDCDPIEVRDLLQANGLLELYSPDGGVRYVFFVPSGVLSLFRGLNEVVLADSTHQLNYGGYILWHAMFVDCTGEGRTFFYALMPNETAESYRRSLQAMKRMLPAAADVQTVVVDRSLIQLQAIKAVFNNARVLFCRLQLKRDFSRRCRQLVGLDQVGKNRVNRWMNNLVHTKSRLKFQETLHAIGVVSSEALSYIKRNWLPCAAGWAEHLMRNVVHFGCTTTGRVESENRHLKMGLSERTSLLSLFSHIVERNRMLDLTRMELLIQIQMRQYVVQPEDEWLLPVLERLTPYARSHVIDQNCKQGTLSLRRKNGDWYVENRRKELFKVSVIDDVVCSCSLSKQFRMPCVHGLYLLRMLDYPFDLALQRCRWCPDLSATETEVVTTAPVKTFEKK